MNAETPDQGAPQAPCPNCSCSAVSHFCPECGQRALALSSKGEVANLGADFFRDGLNLERKVVSTLKLLLFKPGQLTLEYVNGRRARYVGPVQLVLLCYAIYFLAVELVPTVEDSSTSGEQAALTTMPEYFEQSVGPTLAGSVEMLKAIRARRRADGGVAQLDAGASDAGVHLEGKQPLAAPDPGRSAQVGKRAYEFARGAKYLAMPFLALFISIVFRRRRPGYWQSLVFTLHTSSAGALLGLIDLIAAPLGASFLGTTVGLVYDVLAIRRFFGTTIVASSLRLLLAYGLFIASLLVLAIIATVAVVGVSFLLL